MIGYVYWNRKFYKIALHIVMCSDLSHLNLNMIFNMIFFREKKTTLWKLGLVTFVM